jgi:fatty-acid desaturase
MIFLVLIRYYLDLEAVSTVQQLTDGCDAHLGMQAVRLVWVYHVTWFVNSASHVWGTQPWNTGDLSKNNW